MAHTSFSTNSPETKKHWEEKLFRDVVKTSFFSSYMKEGSDNIVQVVRQLEKGQGDNVKVGLRMRLSGAGVTS